MMFRLPTGSDMERWGFLCGQVAQSGDLLVLTGELGAGKTTFSRGFGEALDLETPVSSPTFIVARTHPRRNPTDPPLVHLDAYRLGSAAELDELDIDVPGSITLAEWASPFAHALSDQWVELSFVRPTGHTDALDEDEPREVTLRPHGDAHGLLTRVMSAGEEFHVSGD